MQNKFAFQLFQIAPVVKNYAVWRKRLLGPVFVFIQNPLLQVIPEKEYCNDPEFSNRQVSVNSIDPDCSLIRVCTVCHSVWNSWTNYSAVIGSLATHWEHTAKTLIRLGRCPGWSESSLGPPTILLVLSWGGSKFTVKIWKIRTHTRNWCNYPKICKMWFYHKNNIHLQKMQMEWQTV